MTARRSRLVRAAALVLAAAALAGCAAQLAYRDGMRLVEADRVEEGLARLREASAKDPANARYRNAWLQVRDRHAARHARAGEQALEQGNALQARSAFQRALAVDPGNARARQGLLAVEAQSRQARWLTDAQAALGRREDLLARQKLDAILAEQPGHPVARRLLQELNDATPQVALESALSAAYRQPITIEFRDAPLRQVFEVISRRSGLNFLFDKDVRADQRTAIFLRNSTVEAAIYYLLVTNQLEQQVMDENTILIFPNVASKVKEYQQMMVKTFYLANADAKAVAQTLRTLLKTRDVVVDEKLNLLIVRDSVDAVRLAEKLVALQDVAEAELMLEVEILEIKRSRLMELGISWPDTLAFEPLQAIGGGPVTLADLRNLNSSRIAVSGVSAVVNASKTDGDTNILANPRIRVRNKEKAKVLIGEKVPNITTVISPGAGGFASETVSYVDVGLTLNVEPTIYLNNEVGIRIALEVSNLVDKQTTKSGTVAYQIGTRQVSTFLQLRDGENQVLAGLINNEERSSGTRIPLLGDLPIAGRLFGSTLDDTLKTEIVLSITPHLIRTVQRPPLAASEFSAGTDTSFRRRPDMAPRAKVDPAGTAPGQLGTVGAAIGPGVNSGSAVRAPLHAPAAPPAPQPAQAAQPAAEQPVEPAPEEGEPYTTVDGVASGPLEPNVTQPQPLPASRSVVDPPPPPPAPPKAGQAKQPPGQ